MSNHITVEHMAASHAKEIATLHIQGINTGFISSLGLDFVTALYGAIAEDENSFGFVAFENDSVIGFVAFSTNLGKLYKFAVLKKSFKFGFILARRMLSLSVFKKVIDNIFYPVRMKKLDLPDAELLSVVVAKEAQGKRLATRLVQKGLEECGNHGMDKVKVLVGAENEPANKLYLKCGFELAGQIEKHGILSNIYVVKATIKGACEKTA
ncbi:MAG: GNAT family N-acetyltransferase [Planctomycetota bacterium]|jgi:ribosomal protein S18 acetylase RimI-like enzyme